MSEPVKYGEYIYQLREGLADEYKYLPIHVGLGLALTGLAIGWNAGLLWGGPFGLTLGISGAVLGVLATPPVTRWWQILMNRATERDRHNLIDGGVLGLLMNQTESSEPDPAMVAGWPARSDHFTDNLKNLFWTYPVYCRRLQLLLEPWGGTVQSALLMSGVVSLIAVPMTYGQAGSWIPALMPLAWFYVAMAMLQSRNTALSRALVLALSTQESEFVSRETKSTESRD